MNSQQQIERGIELLKLCQELQSEKDGIDRPAFGVIDKTKTLDSFALDVQAAIVNMGSLYTLFPLLESLTTIGKKLEAEGQLSVSGGDSYADAALSYFKSSCALE